MRRMLPALMAALALGALAGCKSKSVSRTYPSGMDATWTAALAAVEKVTGEKPASVDRERGRIVTKWSVGEARDVAYRKDVDIWRGVVKLEPAGSATRVSIKVEKGVAGGQEPSAFERKGEASIGITAWSSSKDEQNRFLDAVATELSKT